MAAAVREQDGANASTASGVRCADSALTSKGICISSSSLHAFSITGKSLVLPMMMLTIGFIIVFVCLVVVKRCCCLYVIIYCDSSDEENDDGCYEEANPESSYYLSERVLS